MEKLRGVKEREKVIDVDKKEKKKLLKIEYKNKVKDLD